MLRRTHIRRISFVAIGTLAAGSIAGVIAVPAQAATPTLGVLATVQTAHEGGGRPVFNADGSKAWVPAGQGVHTTGSTIAVINTATNTVTTTGTVGLDPQSLALSPNGSWVYGENTGSGTVSVIDAVADTVLATIPVATPPASEGGNRAVPLIAFSPDSGTAYVAVPSANKVAVINTATRTVTSAITVGTNPRQLVMGVGGVHLFVMNNGSSSLSVINTATNTVSVTIPLPAQPGSMALVHNGAELYITPTDGSTSLMRVAISTLAVSTGPVIGPADHDLVVSPNGRAAYVTASNGTVTAIDTTTDGVSGAVTVPAFAHIGGADAALNADGSRLFVDGTVGSSDGVVAAISTNPLAVTDVVTVSGASTGVRVAPSGQAYVHAAGGPVDVVGPLTGAGPIVTLRPNSTTANAGDTITLHAAAYGIPAPNVQWQLSTGGPFAAVPGAISPDLTLGPLSSADSGAYRAMFTNASGTATTSVANVTVNLAHVTVAGSSTPIPSGFGSVLTVSVTVTPTSSGLTPTGTVTFGLDANRIFAVVPVAVDGTASFTTNGFGAVDQTINARYSGDGHFLPAVGTVEVNVTADQTMMNQTITGTLFVPTGHSLLLRNVHVTGSVNLLGGGSLDIENSTVDGTVLAMGSTAVRICGSTVGTLTTAFATGFVVTGAAAIDCAPNTLGSPTFEFDQHGVQAYGNTVTGTQTNFGNAGAGPFPVNTAPQIR